MVKLLVAVAPEYTEQKATIDAVFALVLGLYTYVNPVPTVTGAPNLVKLLTQDCKHVTGGFLNVEKDPIKAVEKIVAHIEKKKEKNRHLKDIAEDFSRALESDLEMVP